MEKYVCQSCGMPMDSEEIMGTNTDGSCNNEYCTYCYRNGQFTSPNVTMEEEIEICVPFMKQAGVEEKEARKMLAEAFPKLKRWRK